MARISGNEGKESWQKKTLKAYKKLIRRGMSEQMAKNLIFQIVEGGGGKNG